MRFSVKMILAVSCLCAVACDWIEQHDPEIPVNGATYSSCPGVPAPGCRTSDERCPVSEERGCQHVWSGAPWADGRKVGSDAGVK